METLVQRDLKHIWHPCSQMKDYLDFPPMVISRAKGCYFTLNQGDKIIDAISSWWCKNLGHNHPRLKAAIKRQLNRYEHVIAANTYQEPLIELSEKLANLLPPLDKVFYASEGSTAVEIAVKMSLHTRYIAGDLERTEMLALRNGYHGESMLAMCLSDLDLYRKPYEALFAPFNSKVHFIKQIPYVYSVKDPLFEDCSVVWSEIEAAIKPLAHRLSFIIFEPLVQGAGGMLIYSRDFLRRLQQFATQYGIHLIADEIMTGIGRVGAPLACHVAGIQPDFVCLSKGLTGGFLPMSVVLTHPKIYDHFFDDYASGNSFLHSNTFSGNALAASVALECLKIMEEEGYEYVRHLSPLLHDAMCDVNAATRSLCNIRSMGAVVAADLILPLRKNGQRYGYEIYKEAVKRGALLRPLGNTLYWLPPFIMQKRTLNKLKEITIESIRSVYEQDN